MASRPPLRRLLIMLLATFLGGACDSSSPTVGATPDVRGDGVESAGEPSGANDAAPGEHDLGDTTGPSPGATETNGAAAPCEDDIDCPESYCGEPTNDGSRFCAPPGLLPVEDETDAGL